MPKKPSQEVLDAAKRSLDPKAVLNAVINEMKDEDLEKALVNAGVARYVDKD